MLFLVYVLGSFARNKIKKYSINKIARELGLFKDNYKCSTLHTTTIDNEDEDEDTTNESDQAPIFTGNKAFVLKKTTTKL